MDDEDASNSRSSSGQKDQLSGDSTPLGRGSTSQSDTPKTQGAQTPAPDHASSSAINSGPPNEKQSGAQSSKRRRGLGVVTPNACTECRKKRAKCDGQSPCGRCEAQKDIECVYEVPVRQSKENLRTELETLRSRQKSVDQIFAALVRPDLCDEVLRRIRNGHSIETISEWLDTALLSSGAAISSMSVDTDHPVGAGHNSNSLQNFGGGAKNMVAASLGMHELGAGSGSIQQSSPSLSTELRQSGPWNYTVEGQDDASGNEPESMNWTSDFQGGPPQSRVGFWGDGIPEALMSSPHVPRFRGLEQILSPLNEPEINSPSSTWTNITADINLVQHLLALYFCWEYPTFASLSKEHFLRDFHDGRHRYCSPMLVNALLALGCRFSTQPMTRANPDDPYSSGSHFFKESQRLFNQETDHHSLTTIQALGIMSIREASCGRDSESWFYAGQSIRLAIEMGLHRIQSQGDDEELAVQSATFWGAFALDHAWSLATGSLPQCSCPPHLPPKPTIIGDIEASLWVPYTDDGAPLQRSCEQQSNVRSVYKCFCELSELVHESLYILHSPGKPLTARDLLKIYTQYLNWYDRIPESLRLGRNFTPAVLFAHMYYHFAILLLFRPLIKLSIIGSNVSPRDVCRQAADAIQSLLRSYSQLYTLKRTPSFVPYFVLTSSIMHLAIDAAWTPGDPEQALAGKVADAAQRDPRITESLRQGVADLAEMAPCHHFAEQALNILRYLATKWRIKVDMDSSKKTAEEYDKTVRSRTDSLNFFVPNFGSDDFHCAWGVKPGIDDLEEPLLTQKTGDALENPLFWPFPTQGRPILPSGEELELAGFAMR